MDTQAAAPILAGFLSVAAGVAGAADWPTAMHDNRRTSVTSEELRPPLSLHWTFRSPAPPARGWALPVNGYGARKNKSNVSHDDAFRTIAVDDVCYFSSSAENAVVAVDAASGRIVWRFPTGAAPRLAPVWHNGRLYVGGDDGVFRCIEAQTGNLAWEVDAAPNDRQMLGHGRFLSQWPVRAGGLVEDGVAYFTSGLFPYHHIYLWAVDASSGQVLWRRQLDRDGMDAESPQGYILSTADSLFLTSRVAPVRRRKTDGECVVFDTPFPDVRNNHEYRFYNGGSYAQIWRGTSIVYGQGCILGYDPDQEFEDKYGRSRKGGLLFNWFNGRRILFSGDLTYVSTDDHVLAVKQSLLADLARNECREFELAYKSLRVPSYLDHLQDYERIVRERGESDDEAKRLRDGPLKWGKGNWEKWPAASSAAFAKMKGRCEWMTEAHVTEALILAGTVLFGGDEGRVVAFDAANGSELWSADTGSRVRDLAVANGRLFVSCIDGSVRCFGKGTANATEVTLRTHHQPGPAKLSSDTLEAMLDVATTATGPSPGYALIAGDGIEAVLALAEELASRTALHTTVLATSMEKANALRDALLQRGLHGHRVTVCQPDDASRLPFAPYLFNIVLDVPAVTGSSIRAELQELLRVTKPCGGVLLTAPVRTPHDAAAIREANAVTREATSVGVITRGSLPGATDWTHNYATAANTYCSGDPTVRGPFGVLWYGEPGPRKRVDRHATPPVPLVVNGIMFTVGNDVVMAYDVYNGVLYWQRRIPGATRTHLPIATSNLVADAKTLFVVVDNKRCLRLDAHTGETLQTYEPPAFEDGKPAYWAWVACTEGLLFGSRAEVEERRLRAREQTSDAVFALDVASGQLLWRRDGAGIDHDGIAIDAGRLFFVDRELTDAEREEALDSAVKDGSVPDREPKDRSGKAIAPDLRALVALDTRDGRVAWRRPLNVTDVTLDDTVVQGKSGVACMAKDGVVVVHGTASLGHPHREFLEGKFARRAIAAFSASDGSYLWGGRKGYRKRPIIVGDYVYAEPSAWHLKTGRPKTIANPLSGQDQVLDFHRGYIGCGHILASGSTLFGARGGIAYWNTDSPAGFVPFANMALACGIGATPANGVFAVPEGRSGCTCATPIFTSIVFYPDPAESDSAVGFAGGIHETVSLPVKRLAVNLGGSCFRQGPDGALWLPYPARADGGVIGKWLPTYQHDETMCYRLEDGFTRIEGTKTPWLYRSGYTHAKPLLFRLLDREAEPARYTVTLHFAEPDEGTQPGQRVFSVLLQGRNGLTDLDVAQEAGGARRALVKRVNGVTVDDQLKIELRPSTPSARPPILSAIEATIEAP